jgi:Protein of unknown function (DUF642)/PEP-CTERM motif
VSDPIYILHFSHYKEPTMNRFAICIAAVASLLVAASSAQANLLTNGSFETPTVPNGGFTSFPVGSATLTGWTVFGPAGTEVAIVSGSFSQGGVSFPAQDGTQWLDLTGAAVNSTEGVSQAITTTVGNRFQLSLFVGNTTGGGGVFGTISTVNVLLNGVQTFIDVNSTVSSTTLNWQQFTHTFIATGTSTTLGFQNGDPGSDNSNGLDNVILLDLGPAVRGVPEPGLLALFGIGLAAFGIARRHKKA